ncbi:hypothetical protein O3P69_019896, partial [Scylla paramamosain]
GEKNEPCLLYTVFNAITLLYLDFTLKNYDCVGDRTLAGRGDVALDIQSEGDWQKTQGSEASRELPRVKLVV